MSFKIHGKNFQAWEHFELEASGLTVLIGPTNEGKSSLFRAAKGVIRNEISANFIRLNSDGIELTLEIDGHVVTAKRKSGGSSTRYVIDAKDPENPLPEEKFDKLNGAIPDPITKLGLNPVEIGDVTLDPIFATQGDPQFLLQEKPGPLNAIIGAFASTERLEQGKREANRRISEKNSEARLLAIEAQEAAALTAQLTVLAEQANQIQMQINHYSPLITRDRALLDALETALTHRRRSLALESILIRLDAPTTTQAEQRNELAQGLNHAITTRRRADRISAVVTRLVLPDTSGLQTSAAIVAQVTLLLAANQKLNAGDRWFTVAEEALSGWTGMVALYSRYKALGIAIEGRTSVGEMKEELKRIEKRLAKARAEEQALIQAIDVEQNYATCPQCGEVFEIHRGDSPAPTHIAPKGAHTHA